MLLNNFFTITETVNSNDQPDKFTVYAALNPAHVIFQGHFPGSPVVPGVCLVEMVKEIVSDQLHTPLTIYRADTVKFLAVVNPLVHHLLKFEISIVHGDMIKVKCVVHWQDVICLKYDGLFIK